MSTRQTSVDTYLLIKNEGLLTELRFQVYSAVYHHGPLTQMEACRKLNGTRQDRSYMPRFAELQRMGVIESVGEKICSITGRNVMVWQTTNNLPIKLQPKQVCKYHHYVDGLGGLIRVRADKVPSEKTKPKRGSWVVNEWTNGNWEMPCFPEILWNDLKRFEYLGSVEKEISQ